MQKEDLELIAGLRDESKSHMAFQLLVERYKERLYWHIRKIVIDHTDCDDVLQNTFIKVWNNLDKFRQESGLYTWLYRIATNEALTFLSQKRKKSFLSMTENTDYQIDILQSDPYFDGDEIQKKLQKAILKLPEKQKLVFNMKYYDDIKYKEMSEILDTSVGALKASYHHAVKKIEDSLKNED